MTAALLIIGWIVTVIVTAWVTNRLCERAIPMDTPDSTDFLEGYDVAAEPWSTP